MAFAIFSLPGQALRAAHLPDATSAVVTSLHGEYVAGSGVVLHWQAGTAEQFNVQRSVDGVHYTTVGAVDATGTDSAEYTFQDAEVVPGSYHYRLRKIVADGPAEVSRTISLQVSSQNTATGYLYAYDTHGAVTLSLDPEWSGTEVMVEISSRNGRPVTSFIASVDDRVSVEVADLASGTYTVRLSDRDRTVTRHVIVR